MSFEEFMALALYDPGHGYYTAGIRDVGGGRGDFATAATLTPALGRAIARWIGEEARFHGWRGKVNVIEVGGGNGALAETVLRAMGWGRRRRVRYHLVDVSGPLRELQKDRLGRFAVSWHREIEDALAECEGRALVFSNELVDAFPAKWLRWNAGAERWEEVFVSYDAEAGLREEFREMPADLDGGGFSSLRMPDPPDGQRVEVQPSVRRWLETIRDRWTGGSMLTIDYGGEVDEIYDRRPGGTMRGFFRQERVEGGGVYGRFGRQDLTLDVNFTDLRGWGEVLGWKSAAMESQASFLERFGEEGDAMGEGEVGSAFRVLWQRCEGE